MFESIFLPIFNMSITASYIIAAVFLIRLISIKKMPKLFSYALWGIVLLRLVIPFSLPSEFSVLNLFTSPVSIPTEISISAPSANTELPQINTDISQINTSTSQVNMDGSITTVIPKGQPSPTEFWFNMVAVIWIIGMAAFLLWYAISHILITRKLKTATLYKDSIFLSDKVKSPIVFGFVKPRIYLPSDIENICSDSEIKHIIAHETVHIKRCDHITKIAVYRYFSRLLVQSACLDCLYSFKQGQRTRL